MISHFICRDSAGLSKNQITLLKTILLLRRQRAWISGASVAAERDFWLKTSHYNVLKSCETGRKMAKMYHKYDLILARKEVLIILFPSEPKASERSSKPNLCSRRNLSQTLQRIALWLCAVRDAQFTVFNSRLCFHNGSSTSELY